MDDHVKILKDLLLRCPFTQTINRTAVPYLFVCKFSEKIIPLLSATHYIFYVADGSVRFHAPERYTRLRCGVIFDFYCRYAVRRSGR